MRVSTKASLEEEAVVDALIDQIALSPVGSEAAVVGAAEDLELERLPVVLAARMRGADPLSPLVEAAQRLCDPTRLSGALTEAAPGKGGGLTEVAGEVGGVTQVD